jgi:hypothetical protein
MPLNLASPGIVVREVDLTVGRVDPTSASIGAIAAPFAQGPVDLPTLVENEQDLLNVFGKPYSQDKHYEHWLTASSFLAYGGSLRVVRADSSNLYNAASYVGAASSTKIKSVEHYEQLGYDENTISGVVVAAKNPGSWANGIRVGIIDAMADQILTLSAANDIAVGYGVTQAISATLPGAGTTTVLDGHLKGVVTQVDGTNAYVKVLSHVSAGGTETDVDYQPSGVYAFSSGSNVAIHTNGQSASYASTSVSAQEDWFAKQDLSLTSTSTVKWDTVADRPGTSEYAAARGSRFDEVHVVVIDGQGKVTGNAGTILEKHLSLSKAKDAEFSVGSPSYWRGYLKSNSEYLFGGAQPAGIVTTGYSADFDLETDVNWDQDAEGITFAAKGNLNAELTTGTNYDLGTNVENAGALSASLSGLVGGYDLFENTENYEVDFLLMGSAAYGKSDAQALANKLIAVAEARKDALAFISPYRGAAITDSSDDTAAQINSDSDITDNVLSFYAPVTSSSYAILDSGYKYMYDRFANTFRYVPLNGDIAGLCARNDINNFPWFSPAGTARGAILNAVKLAYNPSKTQRDKLYSARVNPVIFSPGAGIVLFGDKTGLAKASAFDRINVRRLFVYLEDAISAAAKDQLFEFNDEITRTNFVNIVEPFLRDVQAKRGISDYVVICDETNNTAAVIDNNEFVADIFIKPARSINFIGLTFVATRTGVAFEEVIGNV